MYHHDRGYQPRMKTLAMLLFFASPLASLFRLGILLYDHYFLSPLDDQQQQEQQKSPLIEFVSSSHSSSGTRTENHSNTPSIHDLPQFLKMLQNATTIDEMVQAILSSSFPPLNFLVGLSPSPSIMFASTTTTTSNPIVHNIMTASSTSKYGPNPYNMQMHVLHADLQAVLPFLFVSFILVWVPLVLFFIPRRRRWTHLNEYQNYPGQRSQRRDGSRRQFEIGLKIQELLHCLEGYRMKCTIQQNYVMNESNSKGEDSCDSALPRICIPNDSTCAICLSNYEEDQIVVKSPNDPCTHLFHFDCMKQWIEKTAADDCPCCRRNFVQQI